MLRTFSDAAPAPAHPLDVALEEHALVTAGKGIDRHRLVSRVAPEVAGTAKHRRTRPEQRDGRRADDSAEVRNPSVRCYEHGSAGQKVPQLREIEFSFEPERDTGWLKALKTLERINTRPAAEFWQGISSQK